MIRLKIRDTFHRLIDGYEINESSREVKFSDLKLDFTDKTIADLPLKYQECQLVDVDLEDIEQSSGYTIDGVNISLNYDDKRNFSYRLEGNTYQETTTGKNLLANDLATRTENGITITKNDDGTYKVNGTATANISLAINNDFVAMSGTWRMLGCPAGGSASTYMLSAYVGYWGGGSPNIDTGNGTNITYTGNVKVRFYIKSGTTCNNLIFKPMLTTDTSTTINNWERYTGGIASPNPNYPQEVQTVSGRQEVEIVGKNLFDKENANVLNAYISTGTKKITSNANDRVIYIKCKPNTTYTVSKMVQTPTSDNRFVIGYIDTLPALNSILTNLTYLPNGTTTTNLSITTDANAQYLVCGIYHTGTGTTFDDMLSSIQIEKGNQATTYEEYKGHNYEINLGKNLNFTPYKDGNSKTTNGITFNVDNEGKIIANGTATAGAYFYCHTHDATPYLNIEKGIYYLSGGINSNCKLNLRLYNNTTYVANFTDNGNGVVVDTRNYTYNRILLFVEIANGTQCNNVAFKPQLEKGNQASSYSPYKTPIELCKIGNYQDYIFKNTPDSDYYDNTLEEGAWYLHKEIGKVVLNGSENWVQGNPNFRYYTDITGQAITTATPISNYFKGGVYSYGVIIQNPNATTMRINLYYDSITGDYQALKTWLQTHNTSVYYVLATPTTELIEDTELLGQLEAVKLISGYNEISSELFDVSPILHIWYNFNEAYTWSKINEIIYTGYVNNFVLPSMKNKKEYRELELELLSPLAMATLRTTDVSGRYDLKDAITNILQPLIDDGFNLVQLNVYDVPVNVNYLAETIESAMNKLSNNYNFWWYIDKNKNIYINSIGSLLAKQPLLNYTNDIQLKGLIDFTPRTNATDYCNTVCFSNVRIYRKSTYIKYYGYNQETQAYDLIYYDLYYPLVENIYKIKDDDNIEFNQPIDLHPERTLDLSNVYNTTILEIYSIVNHSATLLAYVRYEYGRLVYSNNVSIDGSDNTKAFQLTLGGDNNNLITGFKYSGTDFELGRIVSDVSLPLVKARFIDNIEVIKNKNIINQSGIVEKIIDMNERITTYDNLLNIANAVTRKNKSNVEEIEMKFDGSLEFEVGNIISVDRSSFLTNGKFIIIDKKTLYENNVRSCVYTLRNTRILENYVDLFRASETYEEQEQEKAYVITANVVKEEIKESYEVENES